MSSYSFPKYSSKYSSKSSSSEEYTEYEDPHKKLVNCVREVLNYSSISMSDRFDKPSFNKKELIKKLPINSPKLTVLLENIKQIDNEDYKKYKKLFKHFIFSDVKKGYGAKIIASCLIAAGYKLILKPTGNNVIVDEDILLSNNVSKFSILTTTSLWKNSIKEDSKKNILTVFNNRPNNIHGDLCRFIILDSSFKEGVDLFDVKYVHIFEDQLSKSDLTQAIGRATRFCGQKGLPFKKHVGWRLQVFNYKSFIPRPRDILKLKFNSTNEIIVNTVKQLDSNLKYKVNLIDTLSYILQENAVDNLLTQNINKLNKSIKVEKSIVFKSLSTLFLAGSLLLYLIDSQSKIVTEFLNKNKPNIKIDKILNLLLS